MHQLTNDEITSRARAADHPASERGHSRRRRRAWGRTSTAVAVLLTAALLGACGDDEEALPPEGGTTGCEQAFEEAERAPSAAPRLYVTIRACDGIGDWVPAAAAHPDLVPTNRELRFLAAICMSATDREIRETKTCRQALARHPELVPEPIPE